MRLTRELLEAIDEMANQIEAGGASSVEGHDNDQERADRYAAMCRAGDWARWKLRQRERKREATKGA